MVELVVKENADEVGDLYLDIAEAYMDHGHYTLAKPLLATLVTTTNYNLVSVMPFLKLTSVLFLFYC